MSGFVILEGEVKGPWEKTPKTGKRSLDKHESCQMDKKGEENSRQKVRDSTVFRERQVICHF